MASSIQILLAEVDFNLHLPPSMSSTRSVNKHQRHFY